MTLRPRASHEALQAARQHQKTPEFKARYKRRAGIEGIFTQADRLCGLRRSRYVGLAKTHLQHIFTPLPSICAGYMPGSKGIHSLGPESRHFVHLMPAPA